MGIYPAGFPKNKMTVDQIGWYVKIWGGGYQKSGIPDLILNVKGYFVGAELKGPDGTPSELQLYNVRAIKAAGGFAFVLYASAFERFKQFIECLTHDIVNLDQIPEIWR